MSKSLTFIVTLKFESAINDDNDIIEVANNIARAIKNETNGEGISPQDHDTYTEKVTVKPQFLDNIIELNIVN